MGGSGHKKKGNGQSKSLHRGSVEMSQPSDLKKKNITAGGGGRGGQKGEGPREKKRPAEPVFGGERAHGQEKWNPKLSAEKPKRTK